MAIDESRGYDGIGVCVYVAEQGMASDDIGIVADIGYGAVLHHNKTVGEIVVALMCAMCEWVGLKGDNLSADSFQFSANSLRRYVDIVH